MKSWADVGCSSVLQLRGRLSNVRGSSKRIANESIPFPDFPQTVGVILAEIC